jgi:hypothetical protein
MKNMKALCREITKLDYYSLKRADNVEIRPEMIPFILSSRLSFLNAFHAFETVNQVISLSFRYHSFIHRGAHYGVSDRACTVQTHVPTAIIHLDLLVFLPSPPPNSFILRAQQWSQNILKLGHSELLPNLSNATTERSLGNYIEYS